MSTPPNTRGFLAWINLPAVRAKQLDRDRRGRNAKQHRRPGPDRDGRSTQSTHDAGTGSHHPQLGQDRDT